MENIYHQPIFLVDDNKSNLLLMEIFLKDKGFDNLSFFQDASSALEHLRNHSCKLLLLDLNMPDISGLEFVEMLDDEPDISRPATIFVTAAADEQVLGECFDSGAIDFIKKPLDSGVELIARVKRALKMLLKEESIIKELHIDALSQLFNRRYFNERFFEVYQKSTSRDRVFHLVMLDIDNFKLYNDTYGHPAGDKVIQEVSQSIQNSVQGIGTLVFRIGGEEFAALFSTSSSEDIDGIIDSICTDISSLRIIHEPNPFKVVTVSGGHLTVSDKNYTFASLYERCDKLLYEAKHNGKHRVVHKNL